MQSRERRFEESKERYEAARAREVAAKEALERVLLQQQLGAQLRRVQPGSLAPGSRVMTQAPTFRWASEAPSLPEGERWPGAPDQKPFWWDSCSSFSRRLYLSMKSRVDERQRLEDVRREELRRRAPLYLRFGEAPADGLSSADMRMPKGPKREKGVSVFRARLEEDGSYTVDVSAHPAQAEMIRMVLKEGRPVFLARGREIALGSDQEPVLASVRLEPLPEGTRVRVTDHWRISRMLVGIAYNVISGGRIYTPSWGWAPAASLEISAGSVAPPAPALAPGAGVQDLLEAVLERAVSKDSRLHGEAHWQHVGLIGARLAKRTPGADPLVALIFAMSHDALRLYDGHDSWHGWRAAKLARELLQGGALLGEDARRTLAYALEEHNRGLVTQDPTIGVCWDADRLDLWREGRKPKPELLSTAAGRDPKTIEWARELQAEHFSWEDVFELYEGRSQEEADGHR